MGRGLPFIANTILTKSLKILTGPIATGLTVLWLAIDLAGPATRVTIPSVIYVATFIYVATLRMQMQVDQGKC